MKVLSQQILTRGCALIRTRGMEGADVTSATVINCSKQQLQDVACLENKDEENCKCVLEIHLCFNYITEIPPKVLAPYTQLTHLSLACNNLTSLPPSLHGCCPTLQYLCVANNRVTVIENLEGLHHLEILDLRGNRISCLNNILTLTNLKKLSLSGNVIERVSWAQIPSLPSLHFLGLYGNKLRDFEDVVQQFSTRASGLRSLSVGCNPFSDDRAVSLHSTLLKMGHVHSVRLRHLYTELELVFSSSCKKNGADGTDFSSAVDSACKAYAQGRDYGRLMAVVIMILKLKMNFPLLEKIDEHTFP